MEYFIYLLIGFGFAIENYENGDYDSTLDYILTTIISVFFWPAIVGYHLSRMITEDQLND